ncbi:hypothetical protein Zmor_000178 [Zophobas morio]|uniref:Uncharacterized protein n=1 Tax=Zophobas morio TaxID=2755281 RepID=A0AA38MNC9_9CUCU|nr:hypothetical protein Zmor_000178 [Zophobas morio]
MNLFVFIHINNLPPPTPKRKTRPQFFAPSMLMRLFYAAQQQCSRYLILSLHTTIYTRTNLTQFIKKGGNKEVLAEPLTPADLEVCISSASDIAPQPQEQSIMKQG